MAGHRNFLMLAGFGVLSFYAGLVVGGSLLNSGKIASAEDKSLPSIIEKNRHRIVGRANLHVIR
jgi:hypothetical protein